MLEQYGHSQLKSFAGIKAYIVSIKCTDDISFKIIFLCKQLVTLTLQLKFFSFISNALSTWTKSLWKYRSYPRSKYLVVTVCYYLCGKYTSRTAVVPLRKEVVECTWSLQWLSMFCNQNDYSDGWVQNCSNFSALAMELLQSGTKPSIWGVLYQKQISMTETN